MAAAADAVVRGGMGVDGAPGPGAAVAGGSVQPVTLSPGLRVRWRAWLLRELVCVAVFVVTLLVFRSSLAAIVLVGVYASWRASVDPVVVGPGGAPDRWRF